MLRIQNGDTKALRLVYKKYKSLLFGLIFSILKDRQEAEDCLQEVFTRFWEKSGQFDATKGNLYSFIVTMARNKAIDYTRSRLYKDSRKEDQTINDFQFKPVSEYNNPYENLELRERSELLNKALQQISEKERKVLHVAYFEGLSQSEISEKLDIPLGTVKYRMRQGMIKLKDLLKSGIMNE
jgi:RNA polymerase sigma-70 factor (ECF subfamily)